MKSNLLSIEFLFYMILITLRKVIANLWLVVVVLILSWTPGNARFKETRHGHALKPADRSQHFLRYIIVLWCPGMGSYNIFEIFDVLVGFVVKCRYHLICQSSKTDKIWRKYKIHVDFWKIHVEFHIYDILVGFVVKFRYHSIPGTSKTVKIWWK